MFKLGLAIGFCLIIYSDIKDIQDQNTNIMRQLKSNYSVERCKP